MRADARRNYERLLAEAKAMFTEHGVETSLEEIARRAGVGIGTLYRHFPNRETLMEAVYRDQVRELARLAHELTEALPPGRALEQWLRSAGTSAMTGRGLMSALKAVLDPNSAVFDDCRAQMASAAERLLEHGRRAGEIRPGVGPTDVLRLMHGICVASESAPDAYDRLLRIMLDGLRPLP
jgi:AcrR family transcriptional regulator